jgi:hypothetical protein
MKNKSAVTKYLLSICCTAFLLSLAATPARATHEYGYTLAANPTYYFGAPFPNGVPPTASSMAQAISTRMGGVPITVYTTALCNENPAYPPVLADTNTPPNYIYGPTVDATGRGEIENLNLLTPVVTGIVRGELRQSFTDVLCDGNGYGEYFLRLFTSTNTFHDVLVKSYGCTYLSDAAAGGGIGYTTADWDFYRVSGPRTVGGSVTVVSVVSEKKHGGATGVSYDINLPATHPYGVECRSGGSNGFNVIFNFATPLSCVGNVSVTGTNSYTGLMGPGPNQYTVNVTNVTNATYVTVTLMDINDTAGNHSDSVSRTMGVLLGDTNADGAVNSGDIGQTKSQSGAPVTTQNFREDVNHDNSINSGDIGLVKAQSGTGLPSSP